MNILEFFLNDGQMETIIASLLLLINEYLAILKKLKKS